MKYVVIVNGKPFVGKTTIAKIAGEWYHDCIGVSGGVPGGVYTKSAVDKVYDVYRQLGWNGIKTPEFRKDMSDIKSMYIRNCDGPTRDIVEFVLGLDKDYDQIVFYDCREIPEIEKTVNIFKSLGFMGIRVTTLFVKRYDKENITYNNESDDGVDNYDYIYEIKNDHGLDDLKDKVWKFCFELFVMYTPYELEGKYYGNK